MNKTQCVYPKCGKMVRSSDYEVHISYCRKAWNVEFVACEFNKTHSIPDLEMERHLKCCPDKRKIQHFMERQSSILEQRPMLTNGVTNSGTTSSPSTGRGNLRTANRVPPVSIHTVDDMLPAPSRG